MPQRNRFLYRSLTLAGLLMGLAMGCGDDGGGGGDDDAPPSEGGEGGEGASIAGRGGTGGTGVGGRAGAPVGGTTGASGDTGEAGEGTAGGDGEGGAAGGGSAPTSADIDDVISAVCDWEFRCCDEGERQYRLSPFADDAAECARRLIFEMRRSNSTDNPYKSGPAAPGGLLGVLAYSVDLSRVDVNPAGAAQCVAAWKTRGCNEEVEASLHCEGAGDADPCALSNLFAPKVPVGGECTIALAESTVANDVECVAGSTCLPAGDPEHDKDVPICVTRSLVGDPCTADSRCDFDLYCKDGECTPKGGAGDDCSFQDEEEPLPGDEKDKCKAGLTCHPVELTCVEPCSIDYTCTADAQCPEGSGCAPVEVAEKTDQFKACTAVGDTAADLCDTDADCIEKNYCDGTNCQADRAANAACTAQNQCATGLFCDVGNTGTCISKLAQMTACTQNYQCQADATCVNAGSKGTICRRSLLPAGETCGADAACASGRCERATGAATETTCIAGAEKGDSCDSLTTDGSSLRCGPGLTCQGDPTMVNGGRCVDQVDPGLDCENAMGAPTDALCKNGSVCADPWDEGAICTDAAVPKANGGSGLVCDGA